MTATVPFSWRNLQVCLRTSPYVLASDDLTTQRGLVATAAAILERQAISLARATHVSWTPQAVIDRRVARQCPTSPRGVAQDAPPPAGPSGGSLIEKRPPAPSQPRPGGSAVRIPLPEVREPVGVGAPPSRRPVPAPAVVGGADGWF
jgi:hypothetical protein